MKRKNSSILLCMAIFVFAGTVAAGVGGCAPANRGSSSAAQYRIAEGESALHEAHNDSLESVSVLESAKCMLQKARLAFSVGEYKIASWRAEEALADVAYARARAAEEQAGRNADSLLRSNEKLKTGMNNMPNQ